MPRSILLVDNDKDLADIVAGMLTALGYPVTMLDSDTRALASMHGISFGLLVTTQRSGVATTAMFAREARLLLPSLKVMLITGAGQGPAGDDAVFDAILRKPFDMAALSATVSALLAASPPPAHD